MTAPFTIMAGNAIGGGVDFSTSILKVTGGKSEAPEATTEQLKKLLKNLGVKDIRIGGAKAHGVSLDLGEVSLPSFTGRRTSGRFEIEQDDGILADMSKPRRL